MDFEDLSRRATFRSPWPESAFCLICDGEQDVEIEMTVRLSAPGPVRVAVGDREIGIVDAAERWTRTGLRIERVHLRQGLNRLTLSWPPPTMDGGTALAAAADRLEVGIAADLHPVFGEVFSLLARPRPESSPGASPGGIDTCSI